MTRSALWLRFIESLRIRRSDRRVSLLRLNYPQRKIWRRIAPLIDDGTPIRLIVLKARREGISTLIEALLMTFITESDYVNALITAHMKRPATKIWNMSKMYATSHPVLNRIANVGAGVITVGNSTLEVTTAGSPESERGGDLTAWHGSEGGYYADPGVMTATMQSLPSDKRVFSIGVLESTANGKVGDGRLFYREWQRAIQGDSGWIAEFIAWHEMVEYQIPGATIEGADAEERALRQRFELTDAQLAWRRLKIDEDLQGDIDQFHQEFPSYPEEAFIASGLPFFRHQYLIHLEGHLRKGLRFTIETDGRLHPEDRGYLEIWKMPEPGHTYVIGSDSSMGMEDGNEDDDEEGTGGKHSRSAAEVLDMETMEQVAEYDAVSAPHVMAQHLAGMGRLYNNALLAPEIQSSGGGGGREILVFLHELSYWNIHRWNKNEDKVQPQPKVLLGWETSSRTRPRMLARLRQVIMEKAVVMHSRRLFDQISNFGENDSGRMEALAGHDDLLFAYGIAIMSRSENYFRMPSTPTVATPIDWQALGIRVGLAAPDTGEGIRQRLALAQATSGEPKSFLDY